MVYDDFWTLVFSPTTGNNGLTSFLRLRGHGRLGLLLPGAAGNGHLFLVRFGLGLNGNRYRWLWEGNVFQDIGFIWVHSVLPVVVPFRPAMARYRRLVLL